MGRVLQSHNQDGVVGRGGLWKETPFSKKTCNLFFFYILHGCSLYVGMFTY